MLDFAELIKRQEPLHDDLKPYLCDSRTAWGACLKHPLLFAIPYTEQMNALYNAQYQAKKEEIDESRKRKDWSRYIWFHERPYRLETFSTSEANYRMKNIGSYLATFGPTVKIFGNIAGCSTRYCIPTGLARPR